MRANLQNGFLPNSVLLGQLNVQNLLADFATSPNFFWGIKTAFGDEIEISALEQFYRQWQDSHLTDFPEVEIRSTSELNGANGAFASETGKIYIADNFLTENDFLAITNLLLEEYGHYLDAQINYRDAPGDEGAIFAAIVRGSKLNTIELARLKAENDSNLAILDGEEIAIEANADLNLVANGLDSFFNTLQNALNSEVFGANFPLFGDSLKDSTATSIQFIENLRSLTIGDLQQLVNPTAQELKNTLENSLGDIIKTEIEIITDNPNDFKISLSLSQSGMDSLSLASNLGFPGLGKNGSDSSGLGLDLSGEIETNTNYTFGLDFGVDNNGFYFDTAKPEDLTINLNASNLNATGQLGVLEIEAIDNPEDKTELTAMFQIDLQDSDNKLYTSELSNLDFTDLITADLNNLKTDINLKLNTIVNTLESLPAVAADLNIDWDLAAGTEINAALDNISLNANSFFNTFAKPIISKVQSITEPVKPIIDTLTRDIDLGVIEVNLFDIAETLNYIDEDDLNFIKSIDGLFTLIDSIPSDSELIIPIYDSLKLGEGINSLDFEPTIPDNILKLDPTAELKAGSDRDEFIVFYDRIDNSEEQKGLQFPVLNDPKNVLNLLLGNYEEVDLFTYDLPDLDFNAEYSQFFPIVGIIGAVIEGTFGATINLEFGFDGNGLDSSNPNANFFDSFYLMQDESEPQVVFNTGLNAFAAANVALASAGVGGGINSSINFNLRGDTSEPKVYLNDELIEKLSDPKNGLFDTSGQLSAGLSAYAKAGIDPLSYTKRFNSPRVVLLTYGAEENPPPPPPDLILASSDNSSLQLHLGPLAFKREKPNLLEDDAETFFLTGNSTTVLVSAFNEAQKYENVDRIIGDGGEENDIINLNHSVSIPGKIAGGNGNDLIIGGRADDTLSGGNDRDELIGGAGNDRLIGNADWDRLYGEEGDDLLEGDIEGDIFAENQIQDDFLIGGAGADTLNGGVGFDIASYETSTEGIALNLATGEATGDAIGDVFQSIEQIDGSVYGDTLIGDRQNNRFSGAHGDDSLNGAAGDDILLPGYGDDFIDGGEGNDLLVIDYSQLPTAAVAWKETNPNSASESTFLVGNAYGVGTPTIQLQDYKNSFGDGTIAIAADGLTVAWVGEAGLSVQRIDRTEPPIVLPNNASRSEVSLSADGSKIAWSGFSDNGTAIFVANSDGTEIVKIVDFEREKLRFAEAIAIEPSSIREGFLGDFTLSDDGSKVAWSANWGYENGGETTAYIAVTNSDGTQTARSPFVSSSSSSRVFSGSPSLAADGNKVTWVSQEYDNDDFGTLKTGSQILVANSDFTEISQVSRTSSDRFNADRVYYPSISADASQVAWQNDSAGSGDRVIVARIDTSPFQLTEISSELLTGAYFYPLSFSADGDLVAFGNRVEAENPNLNGLFVTNADGRGEPILIREFASGGNTFDEALSAYVDLGVRYGDFDVATGSGEIITWGPSHVQFDNIEKFDLKGTIYGDLLYGGNLNDTLEGSGGMDTLQGGLGDDTYRLDPLSAAGSEIQDTGGTDTLNLVTIVYPNEDVKSNSDFKLKLPEEREIMLTFGQSTSSTIGLIRENTSLIIDLNQDGIANTADDLKILNFFDRSGMSAGDGFIENIAHLSGADILDFF